MRKVIIEDEWATHPICAVNPGLFIILGRGSGKTELRLRKICEALGVDYDELHEEYLKDIAEAYQQGYSDGMQAAKEIGKCRIISYSDDIAPVMTIEEEEEVITTTKFDIY